MRSTIISLALLVLVSACGGSDTSEEARVASIESTTTTSTTSVSDVSGEDQLFEFVDCMRENGVDVPDPVVDSDGNVGFPQDVDPTDFQGDDVQAAFSDCREFLDFATLGFGDIDLSQLADDLLAFASCMRENDFDLPDPDFSNFEIAPPDEAGRVNTPFGILDLDDPDFQAALDICEDTLPGFIQGSG